MDFDFILAWLGSYFAWAPAALAWVGALAVVGTAVVAMTPGKKDDEVLAKIKGYPFVGPLLAAIAKFSPLLPRNPQQ